MEPYWDLIREIVRESDIVLEVLDARLVDYSRNEELEKIIKEKNRPRIFVVNKIDLVNKETLERQMDKLSQLGEVVYVSCKKRRTVKTLLTRIRQMFSKYGKNQEVGIDPIIKKPFRKARGDIIVGVLGYPNVGKSSIINAMAFKKKVQVSSKAGTTHGVHWIKAGEQIKLIDTPGVIPLNYVDETKLGLIASKNAEKLKDPDITAGKIIEFFINENKLQKIGDLYKVTIEEQKDPYLIIEELAKKKNHLKKGGYPDETGMSIIVIKDWQSGKLKL